MTLAYGTRITADLEAAEQAAIAKHSHYYTEAVGWVFRAEAVRYAAIQPYADPVTGDGEWYTTAPRVELFAFPVVRWTPCGATIKNIWGRRYSTFVDLRPGRKQYASRTAREAVEQLVERRRRQLYILNRQIARAKEEKRVAERLLNPTPVSLPTV